MSNIDKVRYSRDGDQFHYLWAARRCLRLLSPTLDLCAISIEGVSPGETGTSEPLETGEELIDVGEYYGSEDLESATLIRYIQLKHSTQTPDKPWAPSGLEKTLRGYAKRYEELIQRLGRDNLDGRLEFCFVSNRPINQDFLEAIQDLAQGVTNRYPENLKKLKAFTSLSGEELSHFCKLLRIEGEHESYQNQRGILTQELRSYLPDDDVDAPVQMKELVTQKALSESSNDSIITKADVLRKIGTTEERLFPAPSYIEPADDSISREQEENLATEIIEANAPVIIHGTGGVGKSILSQRIENHLPDGSVVVVYDCFANGEYRRPGQPRHRHKDALVQIANQLAALGLCDPLISSSKADKDAYIRAFTHRVSQSVTSITTRDTRSLLCIVIDAADNAEMAAREFGDGRSFARDLLRLSVPKGLRLVFFCRSERQDLLKPPSTVLRLELESFSRAQTGSFLRKKYPNASEGDVDEFHLLTSRNPRVQAISLEQSESISDALLALGPKPTTVDATIEKLLESAISKMHDEQGSFGHTEIDVICAGLAILRPLVPIEVLASISNVHASAIRSFALEFGRHLLVTDDAIQFKDEPVETWFRKRFKPEAKQLAAFIEKLEPIAAKSAYVSSILPQLMLEADQLQKLVEIALSSSGLPENSPIERREIELQRYLFALKASLRSKKYTEAAKLALKAGGEVAGASRQQGIFQENSDLVSTLVDTVRIHEILSQRTFATAWTGGHHVYEAAILSYHEEFRGDARSRLRMAYEWLRNWSRLPEEEREKESVEYNDIAEIAIAQLNIHGPDACAAELRGWRPREVSFHAGRIVARRWIDHGRYEELGRLAIAAGNDLCLLLAITVELREVHRNPPKDAAERALRLILNTRVNVKSDNHFDSRETVIQAITAIVEAGYEYQLRNNVTLASILSRYLPDTPPRGLVTRFGNGRPRLLRAYVLKAELVGEKLEVVDLAHSELREQLDTQKGHHDSGELREFKAQVGALLPWYRLWAEDFLNPRSVDDLAAQIASARKESANSEKINYPEDPHIPNVIANLWMEMLVRDGRNDEGLLQEFDHWWSSLRRPLFTPTLTRLARLCARSTGFEKWSFHFAKKTFDIIRDAREDAESKAETCVGLARAVLIPDKYESGQYFDYAISIANKFGDEILERWQAILDLADRAQDPDQPNSEIAYRFARCAEVAYDYFVRDKHFDWSSTVSAIVGLCPSSAFAILSRWRDRKFGQWERLLPVAVQELLIRGDVDAKVMPALLCFRAHWTYELFLRSSLESIASQGKKEDALKYIIHYMRLQPHSSSTWREIREITMKYALNIPDIDSLIQFADRRDASSRYQNGLQNYQGLDNECKDWNSIFSDLKLWEPTGPSEAYTRFEETGPPYDRGRFFAELCSHVPIGEEVDLINSIANDTGFGLRDFQLFLEQFPEDWQSRMAIRSALKDAVEVICRRHCMEITRSRYYQPFSLEKVSEVTGMSEQEIIDLVLISIADVPESMSTERLFTLVGLLAPKFNSTEAIEVLLFALDEFHDALDESDGDGEWHCDLMPPSEIEAAIAGYIWSALAAPNASLRWEAAHVVRGLCALGGHSIIRHLVNMAKKKSGGPFSDAKLHFYHMHARLWLTIAFARSALEHPDALTPCQDFLVGLALEDEPHVLIRHFATRAVLAITESGSSKLDTNVITTLETVNHSPFPAVESKRYERYRERSHSTQKQRKGRFIFGLDIRQYWMEALGDCFAKTPSEVEVEAESVIYDRWGQSENGHWENDPRARRGLYRDQETMHSHGSYPTTDSLSFYLSFHAIMVVAGRFLESFPVHRDPDDPEDEFCSWLSRHLLSRKDGRWLADRRDPRLLVWPTWKDTHYDEEHWRWSVLKDDFDRLLRGPDETLNLWGRWSESSGRQKESVNINSALVSSDRSAALLTALQTANDPHDYRIPPSGDRLEIDQLRFQLKGWVEDGYCDKNLDELDPWAADIQYPPLKPARFVCDLLGLDSDPEFRTWHFQNNNGHQAILWSHLWASKTDWGYDESEGDYGRYLQASWVFVMDLLKKTNMDLIVSVEIERRIKRYRYEGTDDFGYVQPYFRLFIIRADGRIESL